MVVLSDSGLVWGAIQEIGPQLLQQKGRPTRGAEEFSESYTAVRVGRTTLQTTAAPKCSPAQACTQFLLLWRVQVVVDA